MSTVMNPIVLIPARMAATRLPDKPLADIGGVPMIVRVLRQAERAGVGPVAVGAGDAAIVEAVRAARGTAVLAETGRRSGPWLQSGGASCVHVVRPRLNRALAEEQAV